MDLVVKWEDIQEGDMFDDDSHVISKHNIYNSPSYSITRKLTNIEKIKRFLGINIINSISLSEDHLLLCNISQCSNEIKNIIYEICDNYNIPTEYNQHIFINEDIKEPIVTFEEITNIKYEILKSDKAKVDKDIYWLPMNLINKIFNEYEEKNLEIFNIYENNIKKSLNIENIQYIGNKNVFCVETDTHKFAVNGFIHHNSVTLRDIIFHSITHGDKIKVALVDVKMTEFTQFKNMKNVIAVANTIPEAVELLRIAKQAMYKRNNELAKAQVTDIADYKPKKPLDTFTLAGRKFHENQDISIRLVDGTEKIVKVKELEEYLD